MLVDDDGGDVEAFQPGRKIAATVLIVDGQRTTVEVSFMKGDDPVVITRVQK